MKTPTPIEKLAQEALSLTHLLRDLRDPVELARHAAAHKVHESVLRKESQRMEADLRRRFTALLFDGAVLDYSPDKFFEFAKAMVEARKAARGLGPRPRKRPKASLTADNAAEYTNRRALKKALFLIFTTKPTPKSWDDVIDQLHKWSVNYTDHAHVMNTTRKLGFSFHPRRRKL